MGEALPSWVIQHKSKNIEIRKINQNYYAYRIKSVWDKRKQRARKITVSYAGSITPDGILPPKHQREQTVNAVMDYGNIHFARHFTGKLMEQLRRHFPYTYESIMTATIIRLCYKPALKNFSFHYQTSYLQYLYPKAHLSPKTISELLQAIGTDYGRHLEFFKSLSEGKQHLAIDLTEIFSESENITWLARGYNSKKARYRQVQLLLMYSLDQHLPSFLKMIPGNIADVTTLTNVVHESTLSNVIIVADRGFYSRKNILGLDKSKLQYVIPVVRQHQSFLKFVSDDSYSNFFSFRDRHIWYREYSYGPKRIVQFLDKKLKQEEETSFLHAVEKEEKTLDEYKQQKNQFGVISIITNTAMTLEEIYRLYKKRVEIEVAFDVWKNNLEGDKTYMRSNESIRGYFFITFLALHLYFQIINHLRERDLLKKYSVEDVLLHLSKIYAVRLGSKEITSEITEKTKRLLEQLQVPIP